MSVEFLVPRWRDWLDPFRIINASAILIPATQCLCDLSFTKHLRALLSSVFNLSIVTAFYV